MSPRGNVYVPACGSILIQPSRLGGSNRGHRGRPPPRTISGSAPSEKNVNLSSEFIIYMAIPMKGCRIVACIISITHCSGLSIGVCGMGRIASIEDSFVCCPGKCATCDELQCVDGGDNECCSPSIHKLSAPCQHLDDVGCIIGDESSRNGSAAFRIVMGARATWAQARQLAHSTAFCRSGRSGESADGRYRGCCPAKCATCDIDACDRIVELGCCVDEATHPQCTHPDNVSCVVRRFEVDAKEFKGARRDAAADEDGMVHVVIAGDRVQSLGILASARSVFQSTNRPDRVSLHIVVDPPTLENISTSLRCVMALDAGPRRFEVYSFNVSRFAHIGMRNYTIRAPATSQKGNLAAGPNFARFFLAQLLPPFVKKVVYLDADTVILKDVTALFDTSLTEATPHDFAVAAVSRKYKPICGSYLNCRSPQVRSLLKSQGIYDPNAELDAFNAGVMVIHLERWRRLAMTARVQFWLFWNSKVPLYKLGSNPPLVLAVRDKFQHLDSRWNCQRGHSCWDNLDAGALHWNGFQKPWVLASKRDVFAWLPFLRGVLDDHQCVRPRRPRTRVSQAFIVSGQLPSTRRRHSYAPGRHDKARATSTRFGCFRRQREFQTASHQTARSREARIGQG